MSTLNEAVHVLKRAESLITGARHADYGDPYDDFDRVATMWSAVTGHQFTPHDVPMAMICLKLSRLTESPGNQDHWTDICGYAALGFQVMIEEEKRRGKQEQ